MKFDELLYRGNSSRYHESGVLDELRKYNVVESVVTFLVNNPNPFCDWQKVQDTKNQSKYPLLHIGYYANAKGSEKWKLFRD